MPHTCSQLATLGQQAAEFGRGLLCSPKPVHNLLDGLALAGMGVCIGLTAFHSRGSLGLLPCAVLTDVLRWPPAALLPLSRGVSTAKALLCTQLRMAAGAEGRQAGASARRIEQNQLWLEYHFWRTAALASMLLEFWADAQDSGGLPGQAEELLQAAAGPAVQEQVHIVAECAC